MHLMLRSRTDQHQVNFRWMETRRRANSAGAPLVCLFLSFAQKVPSRLFICCCFGEQIKIRCREGCVRRVVENNNVFVRFVFFSGLSLRVSSEHQAGTELCLSLELAKISSEGPIPAFGSIINTTVERFAGNYEIRTDVAAPIAIL